MDLLLTVLAVCMILSFVLFVFFTEQKSKNKATRKAISDLAKLVGVEEITYYEYSGDAFLERKYDKQPVLREDFTEFINAVGKDINLVAKRQEKLLAHLGLEECEGGEFKKVSKPN